MARLAIRTWHERHARGPRAGCACLFLNAGRNTALARGYSFCFSFAPGFSQVADLCASICETV